MEAYITNERNPFHILQFLSMKLASMNPMYYDFGADMETFMIKPEVNFLTKNIIFVIGGYHSSLDNKRLKVRVGFSKI